MNVKTLHTLNILFLIGTLVVNYLANALPIGGLNTGELSALHPTLFTPAGFTFAIWGLIYLLLITFTTYLAWGIYQEDTKAEKIIQQIGPWFIVSSIANMSWILLWHSQLIGLSLLVMIVLWLSVFKLYTTVDQNWLEDTVETTFAVCIPFSIYLGWISVATIANTSVFLLDFGWEGFGIPFEIWTMIMLGIIGLIGMFVLFREGDTPLVTVFIWALWGIINKPDLPEGSPILTVAYSVLVALAIGCVLTAYLRYRDKRTFANAGK